jgi:hypothetical protein
VPNADWEAKQEEVGYIKNKPFYNQVIETSSYEALNNNNLIGTWHGIPYVKISEYFPFSDEILDGFLYEKGKDEQSIRGNYSCSNLGETWKIRNFDMPFVIALSNEA